MESNLRDAMEYLENLVTESTEPKVVEIVGKTYCDKNLHRYDKEEMAEPLTASSLTSLVDYIRGCGEELKKSMIIHVDSPTEVRLISGLTEERNREILLNVNTNSSGFYFNNYYSQEDFVINMQTAFVQTDEVKLILAVAGNVENKATASYGDDGISQKTTIKRGIASKEDVIVPNPVTLSPYRTFLDVKQPASKFVFRISESKEGAPMFKLVSADGGLWKYEAVAAVKEYLSKNLPKLAGISITVIG